MNRRRPTTFWLNSRRESLSVFLFWQLVLTVVAICLLLFVIFVEEVMTWKGVIMLWTFASVLALIRTFDAGRRNAQRYPVTVGPDAIEGFNWLGHRITIGWDGIESVRRRWYFAPYFTITSHVHQNVIWLPLHLLDFPEFVETVADCAGPDHPLTVALYAEGDFD
jgi:hypothetical protein